MKAGLYEDATVRSKVWVSRRLKKLGGCTMSDEVDRRHGIEKAAMENVLNRSHVLAANIANELRNTRPEHFVDTLSLADI